MKPVTLIFNVVDTDTQKAILSAQKVEICTAHGEDHLQQMNLVAREHMFADITHAAVVVAQVKCRLEIIRYVEREKRDVNFQVRISARYAKEFVVAERTVSRCAPANLGFDYEEYKSMFGRDLTDEETKLFKKNEAHSTVKTLVNLDGFMADVLSVVPGHFERRLMSEPALVN